MDLVSLKVSYFRTPSVFNKAGGFYVWAPQHLPNIQRVYNQGDLSKTCIVLSYFASPLLSPVPKVWKCLPISGIKLPIL